MHAYTVYGLGLQSEFPIPELLESNANAAEVIVRRAHVAISRDEPPDAAARTTPGPSEVSKPTDPAASAASDPRAEHRDEDDADSWAERTASGDIVCVFAGVGRYAIRGGTQIEVDPEPGSDRAVVRHLLLGPVLAHLLWQRDVFALHASVVHTGRRQVAFVGVSGEGKSTLAAALEAAGHSLVCDDIAALVQRDTRIEVLPGFPRIRLHDDSLHGIGDDPARHPIVHEHLDKRSKRVARFASTQAPLDAIYVLSTGAALGLEPLAPGTAIVELLRHTYYAHQFAPLYGFARHMQKAKTVAERVPLFRLTRPKDLARLPELLGLLQSHA